MNNVGRMLAWLLCLGFCSSAQAQTWPARPIKLIVPIAAGSSIDIVARLISDRLSQRLGATVYVENLPGASGMLAGQTAAKSAADGYTLLLASNSVVSSNMFLFKSLPYDPERDFVSVGMVADHSAFGISATATFPVASLPQLITYARDNPGMVTYAADVSSSMTFMIARSIEARAGIKMQMVPYRSLGQAMHDTVAGQTSLYIGPIGPQSALFKERKLKALAVSTGARLPALADVPTVAETLPGFKFEGFIILVAPSGTPGEIVLRLNSTLRGVVQDTEIIQRIQQLGLGVPGAGTPGAVEEILADDRALWERLTKEFNVERQ